MKPPNRLAEGRPLCRTKGEIELAPLPAMFSRAPRKSYVVAVNDVARGSYSSGANASSTLPGMEPLR
jgi:hypothetical protein